MLNKERDRLILTVSKTDVWPISKNILIRIHFRSFAKFTNEISFDKLSEVINQSTKITLYHVIISVTNSNLCTCKYHNVCIVIRHVVLLIVMDQATIKKYTHTYLLTNIHTYKVVGRPINR